MNPDEILTDYWRSCDHKDSGICRNCARAAVKAVAVAAYKDAATIAQTTGYLPKRDDGQQWCQDSVDMFCEAREQIMKALMAKAKSAEGEA